MNYWDMTVTAFRGCRKVSAGCDNCWALRFAWRHAHNPKTRGKYGGLVYDGTKYVEKRVVNTDPKIIGATVCECTVEREIYWTGKTRYDKYWTDYLPKKGKKILFNCMGDLFHEANKPGDIQDCLDLMQRWPQHTFIVPTKRPAVAYYHLKVFNRAMTNMVLLGSVEDQASADKRLPYVAKCSGHVKIIGVSAEPLLGPIELNNEGWGWVIVGAETGPGARPSNPDWHWNLWRQCKEAKIPLFHKQWKAKEYQEIPL